MNQKQFELAQRLASLAAELDELPKDFARSLCIDLMHDIANDLAVERAGEIYDQTNDERCSCLVTNLDGQCVDCGSVPE